MFYKAYKLYSLLLCHTLVENILCVYLLQDLEKLWVASTWGGSLSNLNFFNVNPQIFQRNRKVHLTHSLETNFYNISNISLEVIMDAGIIANASF